MITITELEHELNSAQKHFDEGLERLVKADKIFYEWLEEVPIPQSKIANEINLTYQQYRYKLKERKFGYQERTLIIRLVSKLQKI